MFMYHTSRGCTVHNASTGVRDSLIVKHRRLSLTLQCIILGWSIHLFVWCFVFVTGLNSSWSTTSNTSFFSASVAALSTVALVCSSFTAYHWQVIEHCLVVCFMD